MDRFERRRACQVLVLGAVAAWPTVRAQKLSLSPPLTDDEATAGLRAALERATGIAVDVLGRKDAFMGSPRVRIPLPRALDDAARMLLSQGQRALIGELVTAMNRTAEAALPEARPMLVDSVKSMPVVDAAKVLVDDDRSLTKYFENHARSGIAERFLPLVERHAERNRVAAKYDAFAASVPTLGLLPSRDAFLPQFIARRALDRLFLVIGEQEVRFRGDPTTTGSAALQRLFRALK